MGVNKYLPHIIILPEDDANRQIANGFIKCLNVNNDAVQVLPPAKGWTAAIDKFESDLCHKMMKYLHQRVLLLVDYDDQFANRFQLIWDRIPDNLKNRVFILGVRTEPEDLRRTLNMSLEDIGINLTEKCPSEISDNWNNTLLIHNEPERIRLVEDVESFLFF